MMEKFPKKSNPEALNLDKMKRRSGLIRIVGLSDSKEREGLIEAGKVFAEEQEFLKREIKKTPEQKEVIAFINQELPKFVKRYGADPLFISEDKIHIVPSGFFPNRKKLEGMYSLENQRIYLMQGKSLILLRLAKNLVHEILHFYSFQSLETIQEGNELFLGNARRLGLNVSVSKEKEGTYFHYLDEAVIEELTKRFFKEYLRKCRFLKEDFKTIDEFVADAPIEVRNHPEDIAYAMLEENKKDIEVFLVPFAYPDEREALDNLIINLYDRNKNDFNSKEEIFELFARAGMSGRILPLARLIEKTFGKGSFRELGKHSQG